MVDGSLKTKQLLSLSETKRKIMDLMAISDRSEQQLFEKLAHVTDPQILTEALTWSKTQSWNPAPEKLQNSVVENLNQKNKGQYAINKKLEDLGLNTVQIDPEIELEKAMEAVENKFSKPLPIEKMRMMRFLSGRGFDLETVEKVLNIYFKNSFDTSFDNNKDIYDEQF